MIPRHLRDWFQVLRQGRSGWTSLRCEPASTSFVAALVAQASEKRLILVTSDNQEAERLAQEISGLLNATALSMPCWSASPYVLVETDNLAETARIGALSAFHQEPAANRVLVVPVWEWIKRQLTPSILANRSLLLMEGEEVDRTRLLSDLVDLGYMRAEIASEPGSFAARGGIIDVFPAGAARGVRIDLFGDEIDGLNHVDPETQATMESMDLCLIPQARLVILDKDSVQAARQKLRELASEISYPSRHLAELIRSLSDGQRPPEISILYPFLTPLEGHVSDFGGEDSLLLFSDYDKVVQTARELLREEARLYTTARDGGSLVPPPESIYLPLEQAFSPERLARAINLTPLALNDSMPPGGTTHTQLETGIEPLVLPEVMEGGRSAAFTQEARTWLEEGQRVVLACEEPASCERLRRIMGAHGLGTRQWKTSLSIEGLREPWQAPARIELVTSAIQTGFLARGFGFILVTEAGLFNKKAVRRTRATRGSEVARLLASLDEGDLVVHPQYGVGRFIGLERKATSGVEMSFLALEYKGGDKLFVPVHHADRIQKYISGNETTVAPDKLGGMAWEKKKEKARSAAKKLAIDLLKVYARRELAGGNSFTGTDEYFEEFEATFAYEETPDQRKAIQDVLEDLERPRAMDRLVCGDVGFGKTEVAVRAAFKVALDGKQVAVLVPTTILAEQHQATFTERLKNYPVRVESISRFKSPSEQKKVLKELAEGKVDVVVGTHRLLSKDVSFKDLGLLIIDEEHRFGVGHKEQIREFRANVDVLALTATPIPRTLYMAMSGIRDISIIATPPEGRRSVDTQVIRWDDHIIAEAIERELSREGQVFVLHNNVQDLDSLGVQLKTLVPRARIIIAHGQMAEGALEKAMLDFSAGRFDVLLCTTIIESGLDLPRVNTLIVNNADRFGLAQLYQIRGRVGRSRRQAHAIFVAPPAHQMTQESRQRLAALQRYNQLGSGFSVATMDMEIRGAGELLGPSQSGQMAAVGYDLFTTMLSDAVKELRGEEPEQIELDPEIRVPVTALIPESYCQDRHARLILYRRVAGAHSLEELEDLFHETTQRHGKTPLPVAALFSIVHIKVLAREARIAMVEVAPPRVRLDLSSSGRELQERVVGLLTRQPGGLSMGANNILEVRVAAAGGGPLNQAFAAMEMITGKPTGKLGWLDLLS